MTSCAEMLSVGIEAKARGNDEFKNGKLQKAITSYTEAIDNFEDAHDMEYDDAIAASSQASTTASDSQDVDMDDDEALPPTPEQASVRPTTPNDTITNSTSASNNPSEKGDSVPAKSPEELKILRDLAISYSNRAFCHIKLENYGSAISDAERAVVCDKTYPKGYYRLGCAKSALFKWKEAQKAFKNLCKIAPTDKDARTKLKECDKMVQAARFAAAIASENTVSVEETVRKILAEGGIQEGGVEGAPKYPGREGLSEKWIVEEMMPWMKQQKTLSKHCAYRMVLDTLDILKTQGTMERIVLENDNDEINVCGDVHGQFYDLLNIWTQNGYPSEKNPYLFNGDFVDRGSFSIEVILALFSWKILYPKKFFLARGNHESISMSKMYGFGGETSSKYDNQLYNLFTNLFCYLPLCHVISTNQGTFDAPNLKDEIFVVHGGLFSKDDVTLEDLQKVDRVSEPPDAGLMVEMLWSDPMSPDHLKGRFPSKRGVGCQFGSDVTEKFLKKNNLSMVVRSHEMKDDGFEILHHNKLCTIFSAPNYCDQMKNKGAVLRYKRFDDETAKEKWLKESLTGKGSKTGGEFGEVNDDKVKGCNKELKKLGMKVMQFADVSHPKMAPMSYANPLLGAMMGM